MLPILLREAGRFLLEKGVMPGGLTRLDMIMAGMKEGDSDVYKGDKVLLIEKENGQLYTQVIPREYNGTYTDAQLIKIGLERARLLPHVAGSAFKAAPSQIGAAYKPIHELAGVAADGFRRAQLPRVTGLEGAPTMAELIKDAIDGAKIGVGFMPPPPWGTPPPYKDLGGLLGWLGGQIWGLFGSRPRKTIGQPYPGNLDIHGKIPPPGNTTPGLFEWFVGVGRSAPGILPKCETSGETISSTRTKVASFANIVAAEPYVVAGVCGPKTIGFRVKTSAGNYTNTVLTESSGNGWALYTSPIDCTWDGPGAVDLLNPGTAAPLPAGYVPPTPEVAPLPQVPVVPSLPPAPEPEPQPEPEPGVQPTPTTPGPARPPIAPPIVQPNRPGTVAPPVPSRVIVIRPNGTQAPSPAEPPPVTDPDAHFPFPGSKPITGNGPQATPAEMAKELGRIEEKLARLMSPEADTGIEWKNWIWRILEALFEQTQGRTYTLTEKCPPCDGGDYTPATVQVTANPGLSGIGTLSSKVDAIAALLDGQLGLKQQICPPCKPTIRGELVTINFQSHPDDVPSRFAVKKHLSYRDLSGRDEDFHAQHWAGYSWQTGAAIVTSKGLPWGIVQVWASDNAEGQRVIAHAATAAGVNLNDPKHKWVFSSTTHPRYGRQAEVWPVTYDPTGKLMISKRNGPSGLPAWKRDP